MINYIKSSISLRWFYIICAIFLIVNSIAVALGFFWVGVIPIVFVLLLLGILRIDILILFIVFLVPLSITDLNVVGGLGLTLPDEPFIICLCGLVIFKYIIDGTYDYRVFKHPITIAILINLAWVLFTSFTSTEKIISFKFFISRFWYVVVFYFLAVVLFKKFNNISRYLWLYIIPLIGVIIFTLYKHSEESFSQRASFEIMQPFYEAHGVYSAAIAFFIPIVLLFIIFGYNIKLNFTLFAISIPVLITLVLGLIFSFTRAAWLSVAVSLAFSLIFVFRVRFNALIILLASVVTVALVNQDEIIYRLSLNKQNSAEGIEQHLESISNINNDQSNLERLNRWVAAINMSKVKPIFGFGPGTYPFKYAVYQDPAFETEITTHFGDQGHAHSEYLNPLAESGWIGMLSWMAILFFVYKTGFRLVYNAIETKVKIFAAAILLGLVTYLVHGVVNGYSDQDKIAVLLWGSFAIITALDIYHIKGEDQLYKLELELEG